MEQNPKESTKTVVSTTKVLASFEYRRVRSTPESLLIVIRTVLEWFIARGTESYQRQESLRRIRKFKVMGSVNELPIPAWIFESIVLKATLIIGMLEVHLEVACKLSLRLILTIFKKRFNSYTEIQDKDLWTVFLVMIAQLL